MILLSHPSVAKSQQLSLFDMPVHVGGSVDKNGVVRKPHMSMRKKKVTAPAHVSAGESKLDSFIAKHGGPAHLKSEMDKMTPEQRAKLLDAMAHVGDVGHAEVAKKIGMHVPDAPAAITNTPDPEKTLTPDENPLETGAGGDNLIEHVTRKGRTLRGVVRTDLTLDQAKAIDEYTFKKDGGYFIREKHLATAEKLQAAKDAGVITEDQYAAASAANASGGPGAAMEALQGVESVAEDGPKEGERNAEGLVFRDGRWHQDAAEQAAQVEPPPLVDHTVELAEDREDLADELASDPHSDKAKGMIRSVVAREQALAEPDFASLDGEDDDPNSPNYRFRDTGYVAGSRKELAASRIRSAAKSGMMVRATDIDWEEIEQNPREAQELIKKSNLFGVVDWDKLRDGGMEPGAGFLVDRVYASIAAEPPESSPQHRKDYALGIESIRERMETCKTPQQVTDMLAEVKDEMLGVMLSARDAVEVQAAKAEYERLQGIADAAKEESDALYKVWNNVESQLNGLEFDQEKRTRRKWKPDPEIDARIAEIKPKVEVAKKAWSAYRDAHPELKSEKREYGAGFRYDNDLEFEAYKAYRHMAGMMEMAKMRNLLNNPMTRAWSSLGSRFTGVLNWRSMRGSDAFAGHVTSAKNGKVPDWSWAEKEQVSRPKPSKRDVSFQLKVAENFERVGGAAIKVDSTAAFKSMFNLRDIQSGNWVLNDPNSAAFHVQKSAEAFADLSDLMGIPYAEMAMNGRLAMAFGARGQGNAGFGGAARAHYESVHRVINLTKLGGGGALAHEFFHAIDNLIKEAEGAGAAGKDDFVTERPDMLPAGELRDAVIGLRQAMLTGDKRLAERIKYTERDYRTAKYNIDKPYNPVTKAINAASDASAAVLAVDAYYESRYGDTSNMPKRIAKQYADWRRMAVAYHHGDSDGGDVSVATGPERSSFAFEAAKLDGGADGKYWSQGREMAARAFQSWVEDRLAGDGRKNDYLSVYADNKYHVDPLFGPQFPYPEGEERTRINIAFDHLVGILAKRGTLGKAVAMFMQLVLADPE